MRVRPAALGLLAALAACEPADAPRPPPPVDALPTVASLPPVAAPLPADPDGLHGPFDTLLRRVVRGSAIDYDLLASHAAELDAYLAALGATDPGSFDRAALLAFWINAYNAFTLRLILDYYPGLDSIRDIPTWRRWTDERWEVAGERYSLDGIEHEILRKLAEPRIHFAINCASLSCPDLAPTAYRAAAIDAQLERATRAFLANPAKGLRTGVESAWWGGTRYTVEVSAIFDWFGEDFAPSTLEFLLDHAPDSARAFIAGHREELTLRYLDYDWSLNREGET